ncbi:death effector domain-containing protein [Octopus bimaculoides]|uniref:TRADD-like N-terminal domain-containing protein n=1 Tax=Octopus bimaculoides TaxID=37653 RepID=A0A0L8FRM5_OCTBM|nr:death effector domain-containing protein [Octopus bimaculoides]|eukprot:XP_014787580.1 PREDICTED: death effector domain-containing protein-like [Octopus bimaculoides]
MAVDGEKALRQSKVENCQQMLSLNEMFHLVGDRLTPKEVVCLTKNGLSDVSSNLGKDSKSPSDASVCNNNTASSSRTVRSHATEAKNISSPPQSSSSRPRVTNEIDQRSLMKKVNDGYDYFMALERAGMVDGTNFGKILHALAITGRQDLLPYVTLRRRKTVTPDPVDEYLEETSRNGQKRPIDSSLSSTTKGSTATVTGTPAKRPRKSRAGRSNRKSKTRISQDSDMNKSQDSDDIKKKVTCDIRLRVRAEYCHHENVLEGNVFSNKPELLERQFEKFAQANTILKSRDLGSIICDIKFSELTYLDAFWRDYINGSLLEALKGVFITESLKQAVGHEAIKLLVNVDEDDYEAGRLKLLQNLQD